MKKILCPTDFSETANNAIAYAGKLAQVTHADLTLLNVQSLFDFVPVETVEAKQESLEAQSLEVIKAFKISCYAEVQRSSRQLSAVISERAKDFDLIVMGSNGADDLYQFFTGSNTYNTILKTKIPLLLIPADYQYAEVKLVIFAFNYLQERGLPVISLRPFIKALNCDLKILQVMEEAFSKRADDELKELQSIFKPLYDDFKYTFDLTRSDNVAEGISNYVQLSQADVLALHASERNFMQRLFHKSVTKNITAICNYPLYIFH